MESIYHLWARIGVWSWACRQRALTIRMLGIVAPANLARRVAKAPHLQPHQHLSTARLRGLNTKVEGESSVVRILADAESIRKASVHLGTRGQ